MEDASFSELVEIQPASWRDLNALRHLEQICFERDTWPLLDLVGVLAIPSVVRLKAVIRDIMVGFIAADVRASERMAWIATVGVLPEYRNRGIGALLMTRCEALVPVPTIRLNVRHSNQTAIRLYQRLGYRQVGIWPNYYQDKEDAIVMEKSKPAAPQA